jgi:hypothetical protein
MRREPVDLLECAITVHPQLGKRAAQLAYRKLVRGAHIIRRTTFGEAKIALARGVHHGIVWGFSQDGVSYNCNDTVLL